MRAGPASTPRLALLRLALPLVMTRAGFAAMTVADGVMVARAGAGQVAEMSLANGTFGRLTEVFMVAVMSALPLVAGALPEARRGIWRRAVAMGLGLGLAGIVVAAFAQPIARLMVGDPGFAARAAAIVWILALGLPAGLAAAASAMLLEGSGRPAVVAGLILGGNALNIALNWLLIGGHGGGPAWGAFGSALSTTLVRLALAIGLLVALRVREGRDFFRRARAEAGDARRQRRLASGAAGATAGFHAFAVWLTVFAGWMSPEALAAFASSFILTLPAMLLAIGTGDAIGLRVARQDDAAGTLRRDLALLVLLLLPFGLALMAAPETVARLYTPDPALGGLMAGLLPLAGLVLMLDGPSYALAAAARARNDVLGSTLVQVSTMAATPVLAAALAFGCGLGLTGLMLAIVATSAARLLLLLHRSRLASGRDAEHRGTGALRRSGIPSVATSLTAGEP